MKMNKLKYIAMSGVTLLLTGFAATSCDDANDWSTDSAYDRLFSVPKISVNAEDTYAEVTWNNTPGTEYYIIEISKDSLYDDIQMGNTNGAIVFGQDKEIAKSPYTLVGLEGDTKYFFRIKAFSSAKAESRWAYMEDFSFKTKAEQILTSVTNVTGRTAIVNWLEGKSVTHLIVTNLSTDESLRFDISSEAQDENSTRIEGLMPKTEYSISIYNNEAVRGTLKFNTTEDYPAGYDVVTATNVATLNDIFTNPSDYITGNDGNLVIVFPKGSETALYAEGDVLTVPAAIKSVVFWGEAGGETPVFRAKGLAFEGDHPTVRFYNLNLENNGSSADYIVNQNVKGNIGNLSIENCLVSETRGVLRIQGDGAKGAIQNFTIDNCVLTHIGSYAVVNSKVAGSTIGSITLRNSTVNSVEAGGVLITQSDNIKITIDRCTFYDCVKGNGKSFIDITKMNGVTVEISNTVIGRMFGYVGDGSDNIKATSVKNIATATNLYTTTDCPYKAGDEWGEMLEYSSDDLFVNPSGGDFHFKGGIKLDAGDPRWQE